MDFAVLAEVTRGNYIESKHHGSAAIVDCDGRTLFACGDVDTPIFPRSSVKAIQALFLVESGAADSLGFTDKELALASASHSAEPEHVALASSMLGATNLSEQHLECGSHFPFEQDILVDHLNSGRKLSQLHNNCSGKHAGFLCAACHLGMDTGGYIQAEHPVQKEVAAILQSVIGFKHSEENRGIDGCSIPTYAVPLRKLAFGFAKMATGAGLEAQRSKAAKRIINASMAEPFFVAGSNRACTKIMQAEQGRIFVKGGAEGMYCATIPELGLGIALKMNDGAMRGAEIAIPALLSLCFEKSDPAHESLMTLARQPLENCNALHVGDIRAASELQAHNIADKIKVRDA